MKMTPEQALMTCYWYLCMRENDEIKKNLKNFDIQILIQNLEITAARSTSWIKILTIRWAHSQSIIDAMDYKTLQQALITMLVLKMWTIRK